MVRIKRVPENTEDAFRHYAGPSARIWTFLYCGDEEHQEAVYERFWKERLLPLTIRMQRSERELEQMIDDFHLRKTQKEHTYETFDILANHWIGRTFLP